MFKKILSVTITIGTVLLASISLTSELQATTKNFYPATAEVIELDLASDLVTVETASGIAYGFYGCEDWMEGDLVSILMDDNGTPETILDDKIIDYCYSGYNLK